MPARRAARSERRHYAHLALIAVVAIIYTFAVAQFVLWQPVALNVGFDTAATVDATNANEYGEVGVGHVSDDADDGARLEVRTDADGADNNTNGGDVDYEEEELEDELNDRASRSSPESDRGSGSARTSGADVGLDVSSGSSAGAGSSDATAERASVAVRHTSHLEDAHIVKLPAPPPKRAAAPPSRNAGAEGPLEQMLDSRPAPAWRAAAPVDFPPLAAAVPVRTMPHPSLAPVPTASAPQALSPPLSPVVRAASGSVAGSFQKVLWHAGKQRFLARVLHSTHCIGIGSFATLAEATQAIRDVEDSPAGLAAVSASVGGGRASALCNPTAAAASSSHLRGKKRKSKSATKLPKKPSGKKKKTNLTWEKSARKQSLNRKRKQRKHRLRKLAGKRKRKRGGVRARHAR